MKKYPELFHRVNGLRNSIRLHYCVEITVLLRSPWLNNIDRSSWPHSCWAGNPTAELPLETDKRHEYCCYLPCASQGLTVKSGSQKSQQFARKMQSYAKNILKLIA